MAVANYHDTYGCFPPAYVADGDGKPMHSWRVLILPFLEQGELYRAYDFAEPWDGPNNRKLAAEMPRAFACPNRPDGDAPDPWTSYLAIAGPGTAFPGAGTTTLGDAIDGPARTIFVAEVADARVHWMEPRDLDLAALDHRTMRPMRDWARSGVRRVDGGPLPGFDGEWAVVAPGYSRGETQSFLVGTNFMAIRRYNPSNFYATAVGLLSDRVGRKPVMLGAAAALLILVIPAFMLMTRVRSVGVVFGATAVLSLLLDAYQRRDKVGLITFRDTGAHVVLPPTTSVDLAAKRLDALPAGGRTPLAEGLAEAVRTLDRERIKDPRRRPLLVVVTDGRATHGRNAVARSGLVADHLAAAGVAEVVNGVSEQLEWSARAARVNAAPDADADAREPGRRSAPTPSIAASA